MVVTASLCLALGTAASSGAAGPHGRAHPAHPARQVSGPPDGMSWRIYRLMLAQEPLDAAATRIQALAARPGPARTGFFETKVDASRGILTVYWHGPVPASVQRLISGLRARIDIQVVHTRYSLAALNRDVLAAIHSGSSVTRGWPMTDGSGIVLGVHTSNPRYAASVASAFRARLGVPVTATPVGQDQPQYCVVHTSDTLAPPARCNDYSPFWGGDVILQYAQPGHVRGCTGGFGAHDSFGHQYLITAAHCAYNGSAYVNGVTFYNGQDSANRQVVGNITDVPGPYDLADIPASTGAEYYDGPGTDNGDTHNTKFVSGQQATSVGDWLCESGARGGVICAMHVTQMNVCAQDPDVPSQTWTNLAQATSGTGSFAIPGDSGGPWFSLNGSNHVWAKGIHRGHTIVGTTEVEEFTPITLDTSLGLTVNTG